MLFSVLASADFLNAADVSGHTIGAVAHIVKRLDIFLQICYKEAIVNCWRLLDLFADERRAEIARLVAEGQAVTVSQLMDRYQVSIETVSYTHLDVYKRQALLRSAPYFSHSSTALTTAAAQETPAAQPDP